MRVGDRKLHRRLGATMIYVTHDQIEAMTLGQRIVVFNAGEMQQIDTPMSCTTAGQPVRGRLSSAVPAMNFFRGRYAAAPHPRLLCQQGELPLPARATQLAGVPDGQEIVVGLRPEDLRLVPQPAAAGAESSIEATIENIEPVGNEIILSLNSRSGNVVCRVPPQALPELGRPLRLHYSEDRLRYFNAQSGARLR